MKKIITGILSMLLIFMVGCSNNKVTYEEKEIRLITPDGLPSIAISKAMENNKTIKHITINYDVQKTSDLLVSELMKGEAELAIIPSNLALQAYKKGLDYKIVGTIGWGSLYLVSENNINDLGELKGKEIYNTGKGLTPDIIFKEILKNNNISEEEVNFSYVGAASELAPLVATGKAEYAVVPEPVLSTVMSKNPNIKIILNLNEEWAKFNDVKEGYPQSTLVIKEEFFNEIKDSGVYEELINSFKESEEFAVNNPQETATICEDLGITVNKDVINESMKNSNLRFTDISNCMEEYNVYFSTIDTESKGENNEYKPLFVEKQ
ncbi:ABC transporter substrate-binding protein [Clostridium sp. NSJ-49]|uniref:ABC transporter substrate-binding protein n=1 Tax=Clostridium TaxID=1485 RepID=UPI00164B7B58|nr:ABC transporter substrate-binding protein [Clostridium sp. NSJ-49]MBC5627235.1 ABC transporter substrate-binding protein [Clostridium sp. NSJ-49]